MYYFKRIFSNNYSSIFAFMQQKRPRATSNFAVEHFKISLVRFSMYRVMGCHKARRSDDTCDNRQCGRRGLQGSLNGGLSLLLRLRILAGFWFQRRARRKGDSSSRLTWYNHWTISMLCFLWHAGQERKKKKDGKREGALKMRLHLHFSTLRCGRRVMQILICLTGKLVKFPCFSAINPQITCTLPLALDPSLSIHTFCVRRSARSFRELLSPREINDDHVEGKKNYRNNAIVQPGIRRG